MRKFFSILRRRIADAGARRAPPGISHERVEDAGADTAHPAREFPVELAYEMIRQATIEKLDVAEKRQMLQLLDAFIGASPVSCSS
jgi:hypothetical protein